MAADLARARALLPALREAHAAVPVYRCDTRAADLPAREATLAALRVLIGRHGGATRQTWHGAQVRLCGFRATSTSSLEGAVLNWIAQVERRASE